MIVKIKQFFEQYIVVTESISEDELEHQLQLACAALMIEVLYADYSVNQGSNCVKKWRELYNFLFAKFMDGNVKKTNGWEFIGNGEGGRVPAYPDQPGYGEDWMRKIINATGDQFKMPRKEGH